MDETADALGTSRWKVLASQATVGAHGETFLDFRLPLEIQIVRSVHPSLWLGRFSIHHYGLRAVSILEMGTFVSLPELYEKVHDFPAFQMGQRLLNNLNKSRSFVPQEDIAGEIERAPWLLWETWVLIPARPPHTNSTLPIPKSSEQVL